MRKSSVRRLGFGKNLSCSVVAAAAAVSATAFGMVATPVGAAGSSGASFVSPGTSVSEIGSTLPGNMDVNPYGVAIVHQSVGKEVAGDALVSNFNDGGNVQGTGSTIVELNPHGTPVAPGTAPVFAAIKPATVNCPGGVGLTTALSILPGGWVIVGSLPTDGGSFSGAGCLIVLSSSGQVAETFVGGNINGPWDMTAFSLGSFSDIFFSNVLNGTRWARG